MAAWGAANPELPRTFWDFLEHLKLFSFGVLLLIFVRRGPLTFLYCKPFLWVRLWVYVRAHV